MLRFPRLVVTVVLLGIAALGHPASAAALVLQAAPGPPAQKFVLDYDVPESPALVAIGAATSNVLRGSAAKPVVAHLVNQFRAGEKVDNGIALDFSPYFVYGGRVASIDEYRKSALKRILANTQLSLATAQSAVDTSSLVFGVGLRVTLFDSHDLLADPQLGTDIDRLLEKGAIAPNREDVGDDVVETGVKRVDLSEAYADARTRARNKKGGALTVSWGLSGLLRHSIADGDSVQNVRNTAWLSYRYTFGKGLDLLSIGQWREDESGGSTVRGGVALRANGDNYSLATELFYDSSHDKIASGRMGVGASGELRVTRGVGLIASLATEPLQTSSGTVSRLRVRTSVRWNMSSEP